DALAAALAGGGPVAASLQLRREVLVEEDDQLGPEPLLVRSPGQLHWVIRKGGTPGLRSLNSVSRPAAMFSIVQGFSERISDTGCHPATTWHSPPVILNTWPETPSERSDARNLTTAAVFSGAR